MEPRELLALLLSSDEASRRRSAALELAETAEQTEEIINALTHGLCDSDKGVRDVCALALGHDNADTAALRARAIAPLIVDRRIEVRNLAGELLTGIGAAAAPVLLPYLADDDPDTRKFACDVLALLDNTDPAVLGAIAPLLDDPDSNARTAAVDALGRLGAADYLDNLFDLYHRDEELRPYIIHALGQIGGNRTQEFLLGVLIAADEFTQIAVIDALALCGTTMDIAHSILAAMPVAAPEVQIVMLRTVFGLAYRLEGTIALPDSLRHVARLALDDDDEEIRISGLFALGGTIQYDDVPHLLRFMQRSDDALRQHVLMVVFTGNDAETTAFFVHSLFGILDLDSPAGQEILSLLPGIWSGVSADAAHLFLSTAEREFPSLGDLGRYRLLTALYDIDSRLHARLAAYSAAQPVAARYNDAGE